MRTSELIDLALDWAVEEAIGHHASKPERCFDCKHHEERAIRDGSSHYCWHPKSNDLQWDSDGDGPYFGDGVSSDHGTHRLCPINALTPEPYSTDWSQGGPIIDKMMRDGLRLMGYKCGYQTDPTGCQAQLGPVVMGGPTPLIAAMRCYCGSKLGYEVEIPEELR